MTEKENRRGQTGGGNGYSSAGASTYSHNTTNAPACKATAPSGKIPARLGDGGLVMIGPRHVAAVRGGALQRTFDAQTELLRGCALSFRLDVLHVAQRAGARRIEATERGSGDRYSVGMADFMRLAWPYSHPAYGDQLALELRRWGKEGPAGQMVQLDLFGQAVNP